MKVRDVINWLEKEGWTLVRTSGSHRDYRHPNKPAIVTIAGKPGSDIPIGTLKSIFRQAGWSRPVGEGEDEKLD